MGDKGKTTTIGQVFLRQLCRKAVAKQNITISKCRFSEKA
jgi:hypothetical protein